VALAETAFSGGFGLAIDLKAVRAEGIARNDELLFSESQSRFVVTVRPEARQALEDALAGSVFARIGLVIPEPTLRIEGLHGGNIVTENLADLKSVWQKPLAF